ncbi:hypothetical protein SAMN02910298_01442 [Pseudobutyrivibrio sp. YE44]|uniref:glycosyltransferase family 39 protein n=1 Tax=Pseudobutyrivibrio sp. YE44 TaxID=1520802 RepID=UPI00088C6D41|nr:glycosyltransferase family 39 protein [Pseudobutyrivibrio sp. YE44]SDB29483.1 hypothetical protein SAMN02910298_01442 [Pseudobutyrivibrio sp. YE44]
MKTKLSSSEIIKLFSVILFLSVLVVFFGLRKQDFHVDEVWNYGLSNNISSIYPHIEYGKEYKGLGPFKDFVEVSKGEGFNYTNVWANQANDVHPPLYYCLFHTICSLFPNTFSIWYGIGLNMVFMALSIIVLYKLSKLIFKDDFSAFAVILAFGTTVSFLDTIIFIRMYAQFTLLAILFAYLIKIYWDKPLTKRFYLLAGLNLIVGVFTHYYFLIYGFFLCAVFCVNLIIKKSYIELRNSILTFVGSGILYILMWYHILSHIFRGSRGQDALSKAASISGLKGIFIMFSIVNFYVFSGTFLLILICIAVIFFRRKKANQTIWCYETALFIVGLLYICVVGKVAPFESSRYIAAVGFIFMIIAVLAVQKFLSPKYKKATITKGLLIAFLVLNLLNFGYRGFYLPNDNYSPNRAELQEAIKDYKLVEYCDSDWEMLSAFTNLTNAKSYAFINKNDADEYISNQKKDFVLLLYDKEAQNLFPDLDCHLIMNFGSGNYYLVSR